MDPIAPVAIITGLTQVAQRAGLPSRLAPLVAVAVGAAYAIVEYLKAHSSSNTAALLSSGEQGVIWGLAAVGLVTGVSLAAPHLVTAAKAVASAPSKVAAKVASSPSK